MKIRSFGMLQKQQSDYQLVDGEQEKLLPPYSTVGKRSEPLTIPIKTGYAFPFLFTLLWTVGVLIVFIGTFPESQRYTLLFTILTVSGLLLALKAWKPWQRAQRLKSSLKSLEVTLDTRGISFPATLRSDFEESKGAGLPPSISIPWNDMKEWIVEKAWTDGPRDFRIVLKDGPTYAINRHFLLSHEIQILEYVRTIGKIPVRLRDSLQ